MKPISSTANAPLDFNPSIGESTKKTSAPNSKIGWLHTLADEKGASFDLTIKDIHGRVKFKRENCKSDNEKFGELINFPTQMGEHLEVEIENLKGAKTLKVFLN